jgi:uncharacterized protein
MVHLDSMNQKNELAWPIEVGESLLVLARTAVKGYLKKEPLPQLALPACSSQPGASFVTLTQQGDLRGCIGSLTPYRPLYKDVHDNAIAAATQDPRFRPLALSELERTRFELSILSPVEELPWMSEQDAERYLRPGIDGVILKCKGRQSTFLPQVWEQLPHARVFLSQLKQKAGLPSSFWSPDLRLSRYTVQKWVE